MNDQEKPAWVGDCAPECITQQNQNNGIRENMSGYASLTRPTDSVQTQPITDIPTAWIQITIGSACELNPKDKLQDDLDVAFMPMAGVPVDFLGKPQYEIRKWHEVKKGYTQFKDGDTLFAKITPCFENGKACVVDKFPNGWGAGSTEYFVLRSIGNSVHPKLLLALVKTKGFLLGGAINMTGSVGHKRVPREFVENYPLPLPPLAEQHQIAAKLDELLAQVESLKTRLDAIPSILKRFRQSVLAAAVSGNLTEDWRGLRLFGDTVTIGDVATDIRYGTSKKCDYEMGKTPVIRIPNIDNGLLVLKDLKFSNFDEKELKNLALKNGDILLIRSNGSVDLVGKPALVTEKEVHCLFAGYLIRVRINQNIVIPKYLVFCLQSVQTRKVIEIQARSTSGVNNINSKELAALEFLLPTIEEQTEIVNRVEQLFAYADQIEQRVKDAQARVNHLTQSILAKAFRGELTADWRAQNPDLISGENSAVSLLERIKAERKPGKSSGKIRKNRD